MLAFQNGAVSQYRHRCQLLNMSVFSRWRGEQHSRYVSLVVDEEVMPYVFSVKKPLIASTDSLGCLLSVLL